MSEKTYTIAHFIPKNSATPGSEPLSSSMKQGEIATNTVDEKIFVRNDTEEGTTDAKFAIFSSDKINDSKYLALSGGTVNGNVTVNGQLTVPYMGEKQVIQDVISGNAYVTAQALNDLHNQINVHSGNSAIHVTQTDKDRWNNVASSYAQQNDMDKLLQSTLGSKIGYKITQSTDTSLQTYSESTNGIDEVLSHFKMGWFDTDGHLTHECAPCRISMDINGQPINTTGTDGSLMVYTDVPLYLHNHSELSNMLLSSASGETIGIGLLDKTINGKHSTRVGKFAISAGPAQRNGVHYECVVHQDSSNTYVNLADYTDLEDAFNYNLTAQQALFYRYYEALLTTAMSECSSLDLSTDKFGLGMNDWSYYAGISVIGREYAIPEYKDVRCSDEKDNTTFKTVYYHQPLLGQRIVDALVREGKTNFIDNETSFVFDAMTDTIYADTTNAPSISATVFEVTVSNVKGFKGVSDGQMTCLIRIIKSCTLDAWMSETCQMFNPINITATESIMLYQGFELPSNYEYYMRGIYYLLDYTTKPSATTCIYVDSYDDVDLSDPETDAAKASYILKQFNNVHQVPTDILSGYNNSDRLPLSTITRANYDSSLFAVQSIGTSSASTINEGCAVCGMFTTLDTTQAHLLPIATGYNTLFSPKEGGSGTDIQQRNSSPTLETWRTISIMPYNDKTNVSQRNYLCFSYDLE